MDLNIYQVDSSCSSDHHHHHKVEPGLELLEDSWFFGNLLDTKSKKMSRSFSDPCTSSNFNLAETGGNSKSYEETYKSIKKLSGDFGRASLLKTPSLPPRMERKDRTTSTKGSFSDPAKTTTTTKKVATRSSGLRRAPSLPNNLDNVDDHKEEDEVVAAVAVADIDEESEFSMGKLIRQASLNSRSSSSSSLSNTLPPRTLLAPKGVAASSTLSRARSKRTPESPGPTKLESLPESNPVTRPQRPTHPLKSQKSLSFIESKQLQGLKEQSKPTLSRTMSGFPDKHRIDEHDAFIPDSWLAKSASPPVPKWGGKRSKEEDVKAQIKFWARAVASNVRQEC